MLRRLPKILRFIPGTAQDVRAYFLTLQYWLAGSDENVVDMVRFLVDRYADGTAPRLRGTLPRRAPPVEYPEVGVYHPRMAEPHVGERPTACRAGREPHAAPSACCCCAPTCWPATPATTTA